VETTISFIGGLKMSERKIKVLLSAYSLETHSRGIITVASILRDAGMEVVYIGNNRPEEIIESAIQEDADVIGITSMCGGALQLGRELMRIADEKGVKDRIKFVLGGIFPPEEETDLKNIGFELLFKPGATSEEIVEGIKSIVGGTS